MPREGRLWSNSSPLRRCLPRYPRPRPRQPLQPFLGPLESVEGLEVSVRSRPFGRAAFMLLECHADTLCTLCTACNHRGGGRFVLFSSAVTFFCNCSSSCLIALARSTDQRWQPDAPGSKSPNSLEQSPGVHSSSVSQAVDVPSH